MQGCNPSADSVAGIAGGLNRSRALAILAACDKSQGFGDSVPDFHGDIIAEQLVGHYR